MIFASRRMMVVVSSSFDRPTPMVRGDMQERCDEL